MIGGWFSSVFAGGFPTGGYISAGQLGMTGERGPEPVFGGRTGVTVQPNGAGRLPVGSRTTSASGLPNTAAARLNGGDGRAAGGG